MQILTGFAEMELRCVGRHSAQLCKHLENCLPHCSILEAPDWE